MPISTGLEVLRTDHYHPLQGKRVGLMTNPSATDTQFNTTYQIFTQSPEIQLTALFGPEHGFVGAAADGAEVNSSIDPRTGIPIYSLYGETFRPTAEMLKNVEVLVCDIQDIGVRFYTYLWTISYILEAAGEYGVEVMILDRPNPLGGIMVAGPPLDPSVASFVGRYSIPVQHGMTLGEMALFLNLHYNPYPAQLTVIPCEGWRRSMTWQDTGRAWVPTSPAIGHLSAVQHYPGACFLEGTTLSEGRGTTLPFEVVGAPYIDGMALAESLNAQNWPGVRFRPHTFQPTASKWAGQECQGVQAHITDLTIWRPIETWLNVICHIRALYPEQFGWSPIHPETGHCHFDLLTGSPTMRDAIEGGATIEQLTAGWSRFCAEFQRRRQPFLLYE
ncbi:MAG: DUF1343 domain-containing protein [Chloroflexi bacterium]|nr:DUF1343 domain-containing protein [Chloroflexota bacterium]NOG62160.1 DUF1343 domain-containing protein [Chloroflexota bacterium]